MKNILVFGSTGYVGKDFCKKYFSTYNIVPVSRDEFDFLTPNFDNLEKLINEALPSSQIDGIVFLQGINPRFGVAEINRDQFCDMLTLNLVTPLEVVNVCSTRFEKCPSVVFISSIAEKKGSFDPSYATAKAGLKGLQQSLSNHFPRVRFNIISLGLVKDSPVHQGMTSDFEQKHLNAMGGELVTSSDVCKTIEFLIECNSIARSTIAIDRGFRL